MNGEDLIARAKTVREAKGLHVRITGFPDRTEPFDYYAANEVQRDDIVRRAYYEAALRLGAGGA